MAKSNCSMYFSSTFPCHTPLRIFGKGQNTCPKPGRCRKRRKTLKYEANKQMHRANTKSNTKRILPGRRGTKMRHVSWSSISEPGLGLWLASLGLHVIVCDWNWNCDCYCFRFLVTRAVMYNRWPRIGCELRQWPWSTLLHTRAHGKCCNTFQNENPNQMPLGAINQRQWQHKFQKREH